MNQPNVIFNIFIIFVKLIIIFCILLQVPALFQFSKGAVIARALFQKLKSK